MDTTTQLHKFLELMRNGHAPAREQLIEYSMERVRLLARKMFRTKGDLRTIDQTDDIVQKALMRLHRALASITPPNVPAFFGLAACQIRRVLLDLGQQVKKVDRPILENLDESGPSSSKDRLMSTGGEPADLLEWSEFHEAVESLAPDEREMFDFLYYQGMTQPQAAALMGQSLRTVKRIWQRARISLAEKFNGNWPSLDEERA